jgi:hypothetical protein
LFVLQSKCHFFAHHRPTTAEKLSNFMQCWVSYNWSKSAYIASPFTTGYWPLSRKTPTLNVA